MRGPRLRKEGAGRDGNGSHRPRFLKNSCDRPLRAKAGGSILQASNAADPADDAESIVRVPSLSTHLSHNTSRFVDCGPSGHSRSTQPSAHSRHLPLSLSLSSSSSTAQSAAHILLSVGSGSPIV